MNIPLAKFDTFLDDHPVWLWKQIGWYCKTKGTITKERAREEVDLLLRYLRKFIVSNPRKYLEYGEPEWESLIYRWLQKAIINDFIGLSEPKLEQQPHPPDATEVIKKLFDRSGHVR